MQVKQSNHLFHPKVPRKAIVVSGTRCLLSAKSILCGMRLQGENQSQKIALAFSTDERFWKSESSP
jgi:hypothetical protein